MYAQLPFDDPKTILKIGTHLLNRIKDEKQQMLLRAYLTQNADSTQHASSGEAHELCGTSPEVTIRANLLGIS